MTRAIATTIAASKVDPRGKKAVMKLHHNDMSPFVRKVMVLASEAGLAARIEPVKRMMTPGSPDAALCADNPLGKIPCLVTDDGMALYDSRVICAYLDSLHDGPKMVPQDGAARWTALRREALGDGILDAAINARYETFLRPQELRWAEWILNQKQKVARGLDALEDEDLAGVDIGTITVGCALGYLDFRYADEDWRSSRPRLAAWYATFADRPSMAATVSVG
jgi:glutathione S-transferase